MSLATIVTLAIAVTPASSQELVLTEDAAVAMALADNTLLARERLALRTSARTERNAWNALLPDASVSGTLVRTNDEIPVAFGDAYNTSFSAQIQAQLVFSIASIEGIETASLAHRSDQLTYESTEENVARDVRKLFYNVILLEQRITVAEQSVATAEETLAQNQADFDFGRVPEVTVTRSEVALENARLGLRRQLAAYEDTLATFRLLVGLEADTPISLDGSISVTPIENIGEIVASSDVYRRWDVQSVEAQIAASESAARAQRQLSMTPTVSVGAAFAPRLADPFASDNPVNEEWTDGGSVSVTVTVPLDNYLPFSSDTNAVASTNDALESLRIRRAAVIDNARFEIDALVREIENAAASIDSLRLGVELAENVYALTLDAYRQGATEFLNVQESENDLLAARYDLLAEQLTYLSALIDLEYATNTDIRDAR